jgi:DNA modification methylase
VICHRLHAGTIHVGDWLTAALTPGYTLAIVDGPYGMGKAAWDRVSIDGLADWYAPHIARVSALLGASASVYLWNTAEGWARIDPVMRANGWTFAGLIVWHKIGAHPARLGAASASIWPDVIEVAGHYRRGAGFHTNPEGAECVWAFDSTNGMRHGERLFTEATVRRAGGEGRYYDCRAALHPCQKPLLFAERMIRASTRPGERVLVPFGGTCREAVICEWMARTTPAEARGYDVCELNADGVDYIGPVLAQIRGEDTRARAAGQLGLFSCVSPIPPPQDEP